MTDLKSVLDQSIRIIQAMIDICANSGWLMSTLTCMRLLQMIMQVHNSFYFLFTNDYAHRNLLIAKCSYPYETIFSVKIYSFISVATKI